MLKKLLNIFYIMAGSFLVALSINMFFLRLKIAPGGVSGLATVIHYVFNLPVGLSVFLLNIPLFIVGFATFGFKFSAKTLFSTVFMSVILDNTLFLPQITDDMLLAALFGGAIMGLGLALVFKGGSTTGGTDIAAKVVNKRFPGFNISEQLFLIDAIVVITAMIVFRDFDIGLYSLIAIFISAKVIDIVFEGVGYAKALFIISEFSENIGKEILEKVGRGVTALNGSGMYTNNSKKILFIVVDRRQIPDIKRITKDIDERAFVIITDVREALGEGFREYA